MKRYLTPLMTLSLLLSACSSQIVAPSGSTFDRIGQELKDAAASNAAKAKKNDSLSQAMVPPLQLDAPVAAKQVEPRFDLAVSGAPAPQVFAALVAGSKYSMLVPPEVTGSLTLNLKSVTVKEALEAIRDLYGFEFTIKGNRILIQPNTMQTRMFKINYLASRRAGLSDVRVTSTSPTQVSPTPTGSTTGGQTGTTQPTTTGSSGASAAQRSTDSSRVTTRSDTDFWGELSTALSAMVGQEAGRAVIVNPISGVVLVKAMPSEMRAIENYLKATQLVVERQVMLEAKIVEVELSDGFESGINWAKFGGSNDNKWFAGGAAPGMTIGSSGAINTPTGGSTGTGASVTPGKLGGLITSAALGKGFFGLAFQSQSFAALLSFLESQGDVQVLSSPRVATLNNQKAVLKVGNDEYFVTNITASNAASSTVTGGTVAPSIPNITFTPFFSGISLDVMPQIDDDGAVILHIHPSVSDVTEKVKEIDLGANFGSPLRVPLASSKIAETDSIVRVSDGNIVAIGGLMSEVQRRDRAGLPGTSGNTFLSGVFGQTSTKFRKRELVILLKPTVIQDENTWRQDLMETQTRVQTYDPRPYLPK